MEDTILGILRLIFFVTIGFIVGKAIEQWAAGDKSRPSLRIELRNQTVEGSHHPYVHYHVVVMGLMPVSRRTELAFSASIFDVTETDEKGEPAMRPVLSTLDQFREPNTPCFHDARTLGETETGFAFEGWTPVLEFIPETLLPPRGGHRKFRVYVTAYDAKQPPKFDKGWFDGDVLYNDSVEFEWDVAGEGYIEQELQARRAEELIVELAMATARADGTVGEHEAALVHRWIESRVSRLAEDERPERYEVLARLQARGREPEDGAEDREGLVDALRACNSPEACTAAVELCLDVMVADGRADRTELEQINDLARRLDVDPGRFAELKDKRVAGARHETVTGVDYHALLGIDPAWDRERVRLHLNGLYTTWNGRAEAFTDPERRAQAERMLETIARARETLLA